MNSYTYVPVTDIVIGDTIYTFNGKPLKVKRIDIEAGLNDGDILITFPKLNSAGEEVRGGTGFGYFPEGHPRYGDLIPVVKRLDRN